MTLLHKASLAAALVARGDDGKTLYLCARDRLYRMPLRIAGVRPKVATR